jgi:hypothetical protein
MSQGATNTMNLGNRAQRLAYQLAAKKEQLLSTSPHRLQATATIEQIKPTYSTNGSINNFRPGTSKTFITSNRHAHLFSYRQFATLVSEDATSASPNYSKWQVKLIA